MVVMMVLPLFLARFLRSLTMLTALKLSSPDVGSSRSTSYGSEISSTPIAVLLSSLFEIAYIFPPPII
jgi:hypothetical protein